MRTRKKQKIGSLFKWMRLVEFLTHQGLSAFQQTGHFTTKETRFVLFVKTQFVLFVKMFNVLKPILQLITLI